MLLLFPLVPLVTAGGSWDLDLDGVDPRGPLAEDALPPTIQEAVEGGDSLAALRAVSHRQLGFEPSAPVGVPAGDLVASAAELLARAGREDPDALAALARLDPSVSDPLGAVFASFLTFDSATLDYHAGGKVADVIAARIQLLEATLALGAVVSPGVQPLFIDAAPAFTLDFIGSDSEYRSDVALQIDVGGHDVYFNRAGGGGVRAPFLCGKSVLTEPVGGLLLTGYLADYGGNDQYVSDHDCGTNGGGFAGSGFLYDAAGDDRYQAGQGGVNGGAFLGGIGYLHDVSGNDAYVARPGHTQYAYGANGAGAGYGSRGTLIDEGGHDLYVAGQEGANGGGYSLGVGALVDAWGDDRYEAGALGTNGASHFGQGLLWDGAGNDEYVVTQEWGNANGESSSMGMNDVFTACLYDGDGNDWYDDGVGNQGFDLTVHPKGDTGSQFDDTGGKLGACPDA